MTIFRFRSSYVKGRKRSPLVGYIWTALTLLYLAAVIVGPYFLAPAIFDSDSPSRSEIREARLIIGAPLMLALASFFGWAYLRDRNGARSGLSREEIAPIDDPSKEWHA